MALPQTLDATAPAPGDSPGQGDDQIRALKLYIQDAFGVPVAPTELTAAAFSITAAGAVTAVQSLRYPMVGAKATTATIQTIPNAAPTAVLFETEEYDTSTLHDLAVSNQRITLTFASYWEVTAYVEWSQHAGGTRQATIRKNGATNLRVHRQDASANNIVSQHFTETFLFAANDWVDLVVEHDFGSAIDLTVGTFLSVRYVGGT